MVFPNIDELHIDLFHSLDICFYFITIKAAKYEPKFISTRNQNVCCNAVFSKSLQSPHLPNVYNQKLVNFDQKKEWRKLVS